MRTHTAWILSCALASCERSSSPATSAASAPLTASEGTVTDAVVAQPTAAEKDDARVDTEPTFPKLAIAAGSAAPRLGEVEIVLERTWCFGWCPIYTLTIGGDGKVRYEGRKLVVREGTVEDEIDPHLLVPILEEMERIDFWNREHECVGVITDTPSTRVTLRIGNRSRTIADDRRGSTCAPTGAPEAYDWHSTIDLLGKLVDAAVGVERWTGTEAQRKELSRPRR